MRIEFLLALIILFAGCNEQSHFTVLAKSTNSSATTTYIADALSGYTPPVSQADYINATLDSGGNVPGNYGNVADDGSKSGALTYSSGVFTIDRGSITTSCANGVAPECATNWGAPVIDAYQHSSTNFFPNISTLTHRWSSLIYVQMDIRQELVTGNLTLGPDFFDCGLLFALGSSGAHFNASDASVDLKIAGRAGTQGIGLDYIATRFRIMAAGLNKFLVETPINYNSDITFPQWNSAIWSSSAPGTTYNVLNGENLNASGDYIQYRLRATFDHSTSKITFDITPLASNKVVGNMNPETMVWNFTNPVATVDGVTSESRVGVIFGTGTSPLSRSDFDNATVGIGFSMNGVGRKCEYSNIQISKNN